MPGEHEEWIRNAGLGWLLDDVPDFRLFCACDGDNIDEVCPKCLFSEECEEWLKPLEEALQKFSEIGEV